MVVREPIITIDEPSLRLVWTVEGGRTTHYNASAQVVPEPDGTSRVVWTADFLPDTAASAIDAMMSHGAAVMKTTLDRAAEPSGQAAS